MVYDFINLNEIIENISQFHAHTDNVKPYETLEEHLSESKEALLMLCEKKGIGQLIDKIISCLLCDGKKLSNDMYDLIKKMFINAVYLHDTGKINPAFQKNKMKNPIYNNINFNDGEHSIISALIYIDIFEPVVKDIKDKSIKFYMYNILYSFAYLISRHHSYLDKTYEFNVKLSKKADSKYYESYKSKTISQIKLGDNCPFLKKTISYSHWKIDGIEFYILNRLLYALIVGCDFYATYRYKTGNEIDIGVIENIDTLIYTFKNSPVYKGIDAYKNDKGFFKEKPINALRSDMFLETEDTLLNNLDKDIFYLEAPTGGGKTNISINLALNIVKNKPQYNKIFYIFPFNSLVEQTKNTFNDVFEGNMEYAVINSLTPIITKDEKQGDNGVDYDKSLLDRQFMHYPVVLTTHVNFFNYLFGTGREVCFPIIHLCNSVVILDEIQSYRNSIWTEIVMFLSKYSSLLNMKIIIISATLPKLHDLIKSGYNDVRLVHLIKDTQKYYQNRLFRNRVKLDFSMLKEEMSLEKIDAKLKQALSERGSPTKVLIEFIKKDTAREFYNKIKDKYPEVIELSGDDNKYFRDKAIEKIKNSENIIVVATQVIEAGVDIDMDIGFKDISILDSEEQFLGRINRSCLKSDSIAYFFNLDKTENIYREDFRTGIDLKKDELQEILTKKDFDSFYTNCMAKIEIYNNQLTDKGIANFIENAMKLDFGKVFERMKLIRQKNFQLFIPYTLEIEDKTIDGFKIWEEYKSLCLKNISYSQKQVDISAIKEKMLYFVYNVATYSESDNEPPFYSEEFGGYFFVGDGEKYITEDWKFDRREYLKNGDRLFI